MNSQKILYWAGLVCLATILPLPLSTQAEKLPQNSIEIARQKSSRDEQSHESKNENRRDRQSDHNYNKDSTDHHDRDRNYDGESKYDDHDDDDHDDDSYHNGDRSEKKHR